MVEQLLLPDLTAIVRQRNAPVVIVRDENKQDLTLIQHPDRKHWFDLLNRYNKRLTDHRLTLDGEVLSSVTFSLRRLFNNGS